MKCILGMMLLFEGMLGIMHKEILLLLQMLSVLLHEFHVHPLHPSNRDK